MHSENTNTDTCVYEYDLFVISWSMYDVCITCEDGVEIQAHKCILVARVQYFRSMMGNVWRETTNTQSLSLPFPSDILEVVIDFLYKDESAVVNGMLPWLQAVIIFSIN